MGLGIVFEVLLLEIFRLLHKQVLISWGVALHHAWMVLCGEAMYSHLQPLEIRQQPVQASIITHP